MAFRGIGAGIYGVGRAAQRNPAVRRWEMTLAQRVRRNLGLAAARARDFYERNPQTSMFTAGAAAQGTYSGGRALARRLKRRKRMKTGIAKRRKIPRKAGGGKPPTTPSARVSARYAVADRMTKFKKAKVTSQKVPKSAIVHYKEFGAFNAEKCMYVSHQHWGSIEKVWYGIALGLAKKLTAYAKIYNGKSLEDPCIGPRSSPANPLDQLDNKTANGTFLTLVYINEGALGETTRITDDINLENIATNPDRYLSMSAIASLIEASLRTNYNNANKRWLAEAQIVMAQEQNNMRATSEPIYIQNLDDADIHLYVNSLIKLQNVTVADHGTGAGSNPYDKSAIDANPLIGRVYCAKGHFPQVDSDLAQLGDKGLDRYFGDITPTGLTLHGHSNVTGANDLGRISSIPAARELYGNQTVKTGSIRLAAGAMKFHKTSFSLRKTFRTLADSGLIDTTGRPRTRELCHHTMFGMTLEHRHGEDSIDIGFNRDVDVGCYIAHKRVVHPLKTNYTLDRGPVSTAIVPVEHLGAGQA